MKLFKKWWWVALFSWEHGFADVRRCWRLARHGENVILTGIDAIESAKIMLLEPPIEVRAALMYLDAGLIELKRAIDYQEDEPEPIYPDEEHEANGLMHVVPRHFRQQENA